MSVIRVCDDPAPGELRDALANICNRAKRIPHVVGTPECPTEWDRRHETLNELLTLIELESPAPVAPPA